MIRASIDIGSNSVLLLIAEVNDQGQLHEVANESRVTALGKGLTSSGEFNQESMKETYQALKEYVSLACEVGVEANSILVTATEASRVATNASEFYESIVSKLGIKVHIISGEGEAFYTALGVSRMIQKKEDLTIIDIGGASSEIMKVKSLPFKVLGSVSLPVGSVRATEWLQQDKLLTNLRSAWSGSQAEQFSSECAVFVAGTMTSLGAMLLGMTEFEGERLNHQQLKVDHLKEFVRKISSYSAFELEQQYPFLGKRAQSIIGGAQVALFLAEKLKIERLEISSYGLRYGTLLAGTIGAEYVNRCY